MNELVLETLIIIMRALREGLITPDPRVKIEMLEQIGKCETALAAWRQPVDLLEGFEPPKVS